MHNNYYFLRQLTAELSPRIQHAAMVACFSQNKDELIIEFNNGKDSVFIRASLLPAFNCLTFPGDFSRAKKNSVDIFQRIILKKVIGIRQFQNERSFAIQLGDRHNVLFKMHGHRANVLLVESNRVVEIFRNDLKTDLEINPLELDREIDWSKEYFMQHHQAIRQIYFTFGKEVGIYLKEQGIDLKTDEEKWTLISAVLKELNHPAYFILEYQHQLHFSLLPFGKIVREFTDPFLAINEFSNLYLSHEAFHREKHAMIQTLAETRKTAQRYLEKARLKLSDLENDIHYKLWGNLLMANLHRVPPRAETVWLENIYDNDQPIEIKLRNQLSPQKNAELYYRKGKNQLIEVKKLKEAILRKESEVSKTQQLAEELATIGNLKDLRKKSVRPRQSKDKTESMPYRAFEFNGFQILVGKDAKTNDELTLKYTFKDDLWLHARDVAGSHVVVKHQAGKVFPKDVVERAAGLAAFHSKRKNESLCPVIVTTKKFVRKRKGDPAGAVVVERENVMMVEPRGY